MRPESQEEVWRGQKGMTLHIVDVPRWKMVVLTVATPLLVAWAILFLAWESRQRRAWGR